MSIHTKERLSYIDFLKVIAAFMIVMLHVSAAYVDMSNSFPQNMVYFINDFTRVALPIFIMVSGALLLRSQYQFNFKKKFFFILKIYIVWSAFYVLVHQAAYLVSDNPLLTIPEMIVQWIRGPYHFWYLTMLMGFYILMPLLEKLKDFHSISYILGLSFAVIYVYEPIRPFLPDCLNTFIGGAIVLQPATILFYFLIGAWMHQLPLEKKLAKLSLCFFICGLGLRIYRFYTVTQFNQIVDNHPLNLYSQLLMAIGIFYGVRYLFRNVESSQRLIQLSNCTLYIYVLSAFFIFAFENILKDLWGKILPIDSISILIWSIICFICSYIAAAFIRKINQQRQTHARH